MEVKQYLDYLDKEMTIMGILSAAAVAAPAGILNLSLSKDVQEILWRPSHYFLVLGATLCIFAALLFYKQRSTLAWYYGQICLAEAITQKQACSGKLREFFLYEWRRPYDWDKDFGTYPKSVADHLQSWIYRVDPEISQTDSRYLFLYESGASMWLVCFLTTEVAVVERYHRDPYPVWNFRGARERGRVHPYLRLDNLSNTGYEEIEGVRMPARSIALGLELEIRKGTRRLHLQR